MNDLFKTWAEGWASPQQAFLKSMLQSSSSAIAAAAGSKPGHPLEEQFAELRDTWKASIEKWTEFAQRGGETATPTPEALRELFAPARWTGPGAGAFDAGLRHVVEGPKYATLWDLDRKLVELQQLGIQRDKDVAAYQAVVQKAWSRAFERFSASFAAGASDETSASWRKLTDRWLAVADDTLIEVHRSDEFIEAQRQMLRSASDYRLQERTIAEAWCEAFHIPTRTEMDEMQKGVTELRRQLRALQRNRLPQNMQDGASTGKRRRPGVTGSSAATPSAG